MMHEEPRTMLRCKGCRRLHADYGGAALICETCGTITYDCRKQRRKAIESQVASTWTDLGGEG